MLQIELWFHEENIECFTEKSGIKNLVWIKLFSGGLNKQNKKYGDICPYFAQLYISTYSQVTEIQYNDFTIDFFRLYIKLLDNLGISFVSYFLKTIS